MSELPEGWVKCALGDLGAWSSGGTPSRQNKSYYGGDIPWVKTGDLGDALLSDSEEFITQEGLKNSSAKIFPSGSLLIAMYGATIGKTAILERPAATNQACAALLPEGTTSQLIPYVWRYVIASKEKLRELGKGGAQPNISQTVLKNFPIFLPPKNEQRRIVEKVDSLRGRSTRARDELGHIPRLIERYKQAVLTKAFRGELTADWRKENADAEREYRLVPLSNLVEDIRYGTSKKCTYDVTPYPVLRIPNIGDGVIEQDDLKYAEFTQEEVRKLSLRDGDLLVIRSNGSLDLVGRAALVQPDDEGSLYAGYLIRLRPYAGKVLPPYLTLAFAEQNTRRSIELMAKSTSGVKNINSKQIASLEIPVPSLDEQQEIVTRVDDLFSWIDRIAHEHENAAYLLSNLDQAVLAKAFRGELVPQDPDDEPASVLMERIREERAKQPMAKRGRGGKKKEATA